MNFDLPLPFHRKFTLRALIFCIAINSACVWAKAIGRIKISTGDVRIEHQGQSNEAVVGKTVYQNDRIITGANSSVGISFVDNSMLSAGSNSVLSLDTFNFDTTTHEGSFDVAIQKGSLSVIAGKLTQNNPNALKIKTPSAVLAVRGTALAVKVNAD